MAITFSVISFNLYYMFLILKLHFQYYKPQILKIKTEKELEIFREENQKLFELFDGYKTDRLSTIWVIIFTNFGDMLFTLCLIYGIKNAYL